MARAAARAPKGARQACERRSVDAVSAGGAEPDPYALLVVPD